MPLRSSKTREAALDRLEALYAEQRRMTEELRGVLDTLHDSEEAAQDRKQQGMDKEQATAVAELREDPDGPR